MIYIHRKIDNIHIRYNGYEFEHTVPDGLRGESHSLWLSLNEVKLNQLKCEMKTAYKLKVTEESLNETDD